jgi:hypothetical protein
MNTGLEADWKIREALQDEHDARTPEFYARRGLEDVQRLVERHDAKRPVAALQSIVLLASRALLDVENKRNPPPAPKLVR